MQTDGTVIFIKDTRGFRNNNPGNIRHGSKWRGLAPNQNDTAFCTFINVEHGIRAIFKILNTYEKKHNLVTVEDIINRYAPPVENDTGAYINTAVDYLLMQSEFYSATFQEIMLSRHKTEINSFLLKTLMVGSIIFVENGFQPFNSNFIAQCEDL